MPCLFCNLDCSVYLAENEHFFAIRDKHPVSRGHVLIISKRHTIDYFSLTEEECTALRQLSAVVKDILHKQYEPAGYNLAMNCGNAAGQSILHFHLHLIPRYVKDKVDAFRKLRETLF